MIPNHSSKSFDNVELVAATGNNPPQHPLIPGIFDKSPEAILVVATAIGMSFVISAIAKSIAIVIDSWHKRK